MSDQFNTKLGTLEYIAGSIATPASLAAYPVEILDYAPEKVNFAAATHKSGSGQASPARVVSWEDSIRFNMELMGKPADDVPSPLGALFRASGALEASGGTTPNIGFTYQWRNNIAAWALLAGGGYLDPIDLRMNRGSSDLSGEYVDMDEAILDMSIIFEADRIPYCSFTVAAQSQIAAALSGATAGAPLSTWVYPEPAVNANNLGLTLNPAGAGAITSYVVKRAEISLGNMIRGRSDLNNGSGRNRPRMTGRDVKWKIRAEWLPKATFDPIKIAKARETCALSLTYNSGGGYGNELAITQNAIMTSAATAPVADDILECEFELSGLEAVTEYLQFAYLSL